MLNENFKFCHAVLFFLTVKLAVELFHFEIIFASVSFHLREAFFCVALNKHVLKVDFFQTKGSCEAYFSQVCEVGRLKGISRQYNLQF